MSLENLIQKTVKQIIFLTLFIAWLLYLPSSQVPSLVIILKSLRTTER